MSQPIWNTAQGQIAQLQENSTFNFTLDVSSDSEMQLVLIAGSLPPGLTINNNGVIFGTVQAVIEPTSFAFVIRATNTSGFEDRWFSIAVTNIAPTWNDPTFLGNYPPGSLFDYNFFVNDFGSTTQNFKKIGGELPQGLSLNSFGKLSGVIDGSLITQTYSFTLRATISSSNSFLDKTFSIAINPVVAAPPVWLTPSGSLGDIIAGSAFSQEVIAKSPDDSNISYSSIGLPANLSINSDSGVVSGILQSSDTLLYTFSVIATSGANTSSRLFKLNANNSTVFDVNWVSVPNSNIGSIREGNKSLLGVKAQTTSTWIRYRLLSGTLPQGLSLDVNSGNIWGIAQNQVSVSTDYNFVIQAYNESGFKDAAFSLTLNPFYSAGATRTYVTLYGNDRLNYIDLFTTPDVVLSNIFQQGNPTFGLVNKPKILLAENLLNPTPDAVFNIIAGTRRTYLSLGKVQVGKAVVDNKVVYEVLYRKVYDDSQGALEEYIDPATTQTIKPGGLQNLRNKLVDLGFSGGSENLPLWMQSQQIIGNNTSVPGWQPVLEFAYVNPGSGQILANKINANDLAEKKLFGNRIRVDRVVMEPAADSSFEPRYVLFDNSY